MKDLTKLEPVMESLDKYQKILRTINSSSLEQIRLMTDKKELIETVDRLIAKSWYKIRPYIKDELKRELSDSIGLYYGDLKLVMMDLEEALGI